MSITGGDQEILEDEWTHGQDFPSHGHEWIGETWFEEKPPPEPREQLKRPADPLVPRARITQKARIDPEQMIPLSQAPMAKPEQPAVVIPSPRVPEIEAPPGLPAPEPELPAPHEPEAPESTSLTPMDASDEGSAPDDRKRVLMKFFNQKVLGRSCQPPSAPDLSCWRCTSQLSPTNRPPDKEREKKRQPKTSKAETENDSCEPFRRSSTTIWRQVPMNSFPHRNQHE